MSDNANNNSSPKIYLGNLQEKTRQNGDKFLIGSICVDDIQNVPDEHVSKWKNGKKYIKVIINPYKNGANEYGNTHSLAVDTYKPDYNKNQQQ